MLFSAEEFMSDPKREALEALKISELLMLGQYLYLEVKNAMLKLEIRNIIVIYLVDEEIQNEDALDLAKTFWVDAVKMREIEMTEQIRLIEIQLEKEEMQMQQKIKEIEFEQLVERKRGNNVFSVTVST